MVAVPALTPVTTPVLLTVAVPVEDQVPPDGVADKEVVALVHTVKPPVMEGGAVTLIALGEPVTDVEQPEPPAGALVETTTFKPLVPVNDPIVEKV